MNGHGLDLCVLLEPEQQAEHADAQADVHQQVARERGSEDIELDVMQGRQLDVRFAASGGVTWGRCRLDLHDRSRWNGDPLLGGGGDGREGYRQCQGSQTQQDTAGSSGGVRHVAATTVLRHFVMPPKRVMWVTMHLTLDRLQREPRESKQSERITT